MGVFSKSPDEMPTAAPALTYDQLLTLVKTIKDSGDTSGKSDLSLALLQDMKDSLSRTVPRMNAEGTGVSPFTLRDGCRYCIGGLKHEDGRFAHQKPEMRYEAYQCGVRLRADSLTIMEVELLNQFDRNCEARDGKWTAVIDRQGTTPRLLTTHPASDLIATLGDIPPFNLFLMELLHGKASVDPNNLHEEIKRLREEVDRLTDMATAPHPKQPALATA